MSDNETNTLNPDLAQHFDFSSQRSYATLEQDISLPLNDQPAKQQPGGKPLFSRLVPQEDGSYTLEPVIMRLDV